MNHWWHDCKELFSEGDGQVWRKFYSRQVDGQWEYVMVVTTDDGELVSVTTMKNGHVDFKDYW